MSSRTAAPPAASSISATADSTSRRVYNASHEHFTTVWTGTFHAAVEGTYNFATASDDGSMIWLDNVETAVVNNN